MSTAQCAMAPLAPRRRFDSRVHYPAVASLARVGVSLATVVRRHPVLHRFHLEDSGG